MAKWDKKHHRGSCPTWRQPALNHSHGAPPDWLFCLRRSNIWPNHRSDRFPPKLRIHWFLDSTSHAAELELQGVPRGPSMWRP